MSETKPQAARFARKIKQALVPAAMPGVEGIGLCSTYTQGRGISGALFDVAKVSNDRIDFVLFDVGDTGVNAALLVAMVKSFFIESIAPNIGPQSIVDSVVQKIELHGFSFHVRCFCASLNLHNNKCTYCNPGLLPVFMYAHRTGEVTWLSTSAYNRDRIHGAMYEEKRVYLNHNDACVFLTPATVDGQWDTTHDVPSSSLVSAIKETIPMNATLHQDRPRLFAQQLQEKFDSRSGEYAGMMLEILGHSRRNRLKEELGFDMNDPVYIQVISYFEEIDRTSAVILRDMDELGYPDESIRKMKVVLTELLANAIYHGNKKDYTKKITIGHVTTKENTKVSVMDEGEGFDITRLPDPTLPENLEKDCGRGVFIVRNYADAIATNDKGNRITICKNR